MPRLGHAGVERVCSGSGVPNIYEFLRDEEKISERPEVAQLIASARDHTKVIVEAFLDPMHPSELRQETVKMLISILASEAGNLLLKVLATAGVYRWRCRIAFVERSAGTAIHAGLQEKRTLQTLDGGVHIHVITTRVVGRSCYIWAAEPEEHQQ